MNDIVQLAGELRLPGRVSATDWVLPKNYSKAQWQAWGEALDRMERSLGWWLGAWWKAYKPEWGERARFFLENKDKLPPYKTCANAARVCDAFEISRRRENLSFNHHAEVAGIKRKSLEPERRTEQDRLLAEAEAQGWSTRDLRNAARGVNRVDTIAGLEFPEGTFGVIYADPPWQYDFSRSESRDIENQYPTQTLDEICQERVPEFTAENAVLYLWATAPKLFEAVFVCEAWGFEYKTNWAWDKVKQGMGYYARGQHEHLLIATRGNIPPPPESARPASIIRIEREEHSAKPDEFYELIEQQYPTLPKLEWYARKRRPGWASYGNQIEPVAA